MTSNKANLTVMTLAAAWIVIGCGNERESRPTDTLPAATVRLHTVEGKTRVATEDVVGTVRARLKAVIEAKASGRIEEMRVAPGEPVKTGDLLARLDAREVQARLDQALALREQAQNDLGRFTTLFREKTVTQAEFDGVQARERVAQGAVTEAETFLGYTKVIAPFDGVITRKHADVGDLAAPGKPLLEMEDAQSLRLEADVPEGLIGRLKLGDTLRARIASIDRDLDASVSEIAPGADANSRTFLVKFDLAAVDGLRAGQFARVSVPVGESMALRVPGSAVIRRGQMEIVFVAAGGRAHLRLVKTGKRMGDEVELVSGLEAGERVVLDGVAGLTDGQRVEER